MNDITPQHSAPPTDPGPALTAISVIAIGALLVLLIILGRLNSGSEGSDPCDHAVLNAPYETGSRYWDRDQKAERTEACLKHQLDN